MNTGSPVPEDVVRELIQNILGRNAPTFSLSDDLVRDLKIDSDDLSFIFIPELERRFNIAIPSKEWLTVATGADVCSLLRRHLPHS